MTEAKGVAEFKEALVGFLELAAAIGEQFKDGATVEDIGPVISKLQSEPLKTMLLDAYNGIEQVPSEVADLSLIEVMELIPIIIPEITKLMKAIKK